MKIWRPFLIRAAIFLYNFFYPANVLSNYSCLSFAGAHTMLFHGTMMFCFMLLPVVFYLPGMLHVRAERRKNI